MDYLFIGGIIIMFTIILLYYYRVEYLEEKNDFHNETVDIDSYFYSDSYVKQS